MLHIVIILIFEYNIFIETLKCYNKIKQGALGISHAIDVDGSKLRGLKFFIVDGRLLFREIVEFGMISESNHIRQARIL